MQKILSKPTFNRKAFENVKVERDSQKVKNNDLNKHEYHY